MYAAVRLLGEEPRRQQPRRRVVDVHDEHALRARDPRTRRAASRRSAPGPPRTPAAADSGAPASPAAPFARHRPSAIIHWRSGLHRQPMTVLLHQLLARECRAEVRVAARAPVPSPRAAPLPPWRCSTACLGAPKPDPTAPLAVARQQPFHLPHAQPPAAPPPRSAAGASPPPARSRPPDPTPSCSAFLPVTPKAPPPSRTKGDTLTLHKGDITALGLHLATRRLVHRTR